MKKVLSEKDLQKRSWTIEVKRNDAGKAKKIVDQVSTSYSGGGTNVFTFTDHNDAKGVRSLFQRNNVGILSADFA